MLLYENALSSSSLPRGGIPRCFTEIDTAGEPCEYFKQPVGGAESVGNASSEHEVPHRASASNERYSWQQPSPDVEDASFLDRCSESAAVPSPALASEMVPSTPARWA